MRRTGIFLLCAVLLLAPATRADWVHLRSGKALQGEVISQDDDYVVLKVLSGEVKIRTQDVESVERQTAQEYKLDLGTNLLQQRNFARAIPILEEAFGQRKESPLARRKLALGYAEAAQYYSQHNRLTDAHDLCLRWLKLDPDGSHPELLAADARTLLDRISAAEKTIDEAILRAKEYVDTEDWNSAIAAYERAINLSPDARRRVAAEVANCYVSRASANAHKKATNQAAADIEAALSFDPTLADKLEQFYVANAIPGILDVIQRGDIAGARTDIKRVLGFVPANKSVLYVAGRVEQAAGQSAAAANYYARALNTHAANPTPEYIAAVRARIENELGIKGGAWTIDSAIPKTDSVAQSSDETEQIRETENFTIVHHNAALAERVAEAAEFARADIISRLGLTAPIKGKVKIVLHRTQAEYTTKTAQPEWTGGCSKFVALHGQMINPQIHSWQTSPRLLKSVLPHEITHMLVNGTTPDVFALPRSLHEGFAVSMEPTFRQEYFLNFLRLRIKSHDFIPLSDLLASRDYPSDPEFFYAEGYALVNFVEQEKGIPAMVGLLRKADGKSDINAELVRISGRKSLDDLQADWIEWMGRKMR
jgi:tetratricopeptide (TPR) repeat protein